MKKANYAEMPEEMAEQMKDVISQSEGISLLDENNTEEIVEIKVPTILKEQCSKSNEQEFSAIYSYKDENDIEKYQIVRTTHGRQPYYSRVAKADGGYYYGIPNDVILLPYCLPQINKAIQEEKLIFIVEGESKADTINSMGFVATTAPYSNPNKWNSHYSEFLNGAKAVIIIADNDENGELFAENARNSLLETLENTKVGIVRINDIYSNIKIGGDIDNLVEIFGIDTVKATLESIASQF